MYTLLFRRFDSSQEAKFSCPDESFVSLISSFFFMLGRLLFFICKYFFMSVLRSYTVVMKQRHLKHDLVVSLDL